MSMELQEQYDKIYKYCYFKVQNKAIAEDLTQETFLKYFAQNSYENRGKPLAYLYTIAKNQIVDYFRKKPTELIDENAAIDSVESKALTSISVRQAVEALPPELLEIILLRFGSEISINEIAAALEISRFAVRRKISAALAELKKTLRKEDFYE